MNLFKNRPLALICGVIIFASFVAYKVTFSFRIALLILVTVLLVVALAVAKRRKERRINAIFVCLCAIGAMLAISVQIFAVDIRARSARELEGDRYCELLVVEQRSAGELCAYDAVLRDVDGKRVSFDSALYLSFDGELESGDVVRVRAEVLEAGSTGGHYADGAELDVFVYTREDLVLVSEGNMSVRVVFALMRERTAEYLHRCFGDKCGALARGVLLGDTDGISRGLIRDFRRSGTSHLLAVSGLHISMLMSMAELVLWRLSVGKRVRCVLLSALSLLFLGMTGFSMSACRSVLMLLFVYFNYLFVKESDALTALFTSVAVIMLISPDSVTDVGLWLSFFATLGIIAVYSPMARRMRGVRKRGFGTLALRILKSVARAVLLCFVCNVFTSFVVWCVFGEISAVTLISNLLLTPLSLVFLVAIPIGMLFADLGFIGDVIVGVIRWISELIEYLCGVFSDVGGALISLEYGFAGLIIIAMSAAIAVMLVINMKRKALIFIPPAAAVVSFLICLSIYNAMGAGEVKLAYRSQESNEMIVVSERYSASVIDLSSGSYSFVNRARRTAKENYATELDDFVLTHYHASHPETLDVLMEKIMLRRICMPTPVGANEWRIAKEIAEVAQKHGCEVLIYESGETLILLSDTRVRIDRIPDREGAVAVFIANEEDALAYIGESVRGSEGAKRYESAADRVIFGSHGGSSGEPKKDEDFILQ